MAKKFETTQPRTFEQDKIAYLSVSSPVYSTPNFRQDKSILDRISTSYELYADPTVAKCVNFLLESIIKAVISIDSPKISSILHFKEFIENFSSLLLDLLISSNCCGVIDWINVNGYQVPIISSIESYKIRKLQSGSSNIFGVIYDYPRQLASLLRRVFGEKKDSAEDLNQLKAFGDFSFIERQATKEDILPILNQSLQLDAKSKLKNLFILRPERIISYSIYKRGRYGEPFIYRAFPYVETRNKLMTADSSFFAAASLVVFLLKSGREDESISSIQKRLETYMGVLDNIDRVGIMSAEDTASLDVISGWSISRPEVRDQLEIYEKLILSSILGTSLDLKPEEVSYSINSKISLISPLIENLIVRIAKANNISNYSIYLPKIAVSPDDVSSLIRLRDRGDITRTTVLKSVGLNLNKEAEIRQEEKDKGFDELLLPPFVPFQGKGRPPSGEADSDS